MLRAIHIYTIQRFSDQLSQTQFLQQLINLIRFLLYRNILQTSKNEQVCTSRLENIVIFWLATVVM